MDRRDHDRCQELYVKYRQFMYWYVKKHFPDLPEEDIRDILQEVWTSLLNAIDKLYDKGDEGQFAWLRFVPFSRKISAGSRYLSS